MFGTDDNFKSDNVLDLIILYAKYFIYSCRLKTNKKQNKKQNKNKHL